MITLGPPGIDNNRIAAGDGAVWVGLKNGNALVRIDPEKNRVVATVPIEQSPAGELVVVDGYVWTSGERGLLRIDPRTNTVDRVIPRSVLGTGPTDRVWVTGNADLVVHGRHRRRAPVAAADGSCRGRDPTPDVLFRAHRRHRRRVDRRDVVRGRSELAAPHRPRAPTSSRAPSEVEDGGHLPVRARGAVWLDTVGGGLRIAEDASGDPRHGGPACR